MNKIDSVSISKDVLDYVRKNMRAPQMEYYIDSIMESYTIPHIDVIIARSIIHDVDTNDDTLEWCIESVDDSLEWCIRQVKSMYDIIISTQERIRCIIIPPNLQKKVNEAIAMLETIKDMSDSSYVQEEIASIIQKRGIDVRYIGCVEFQKDAACVDAVHDILSVWLADLYEGDMDLILDPCDQCDEDCDCHEG